VREDVQAKGRRYLTQGRLLIWSVTFSGIEASCRGGGALYRLGLDGGGWWCSCPARGASAPTWWRSSSSRSGPRRRLPWSVRGRW
jgi:hypothetical protein